MSEQNNTITAYKAFDMDMKCRGFQYEVGKEYELDGEIECCSRGFHACEYPMDVLFHRRMEKSLFAVVELSGKIDSEVGITSTKLCASHIRIVDMLSLPVLIKKHAELSDANIFPVSSAEARLGSFKRIDRSNGSLYFDYYTSANNERIYFPNPESSVTALDSDANIYMTGDFSRIVSCAPYNHIKTEGISNKIVSSSTNANIVVCGQKSTISSSGELARIVSFGRKNKIVSSGRDALISSLGVMADIIVAGTHCHVGSLGNCTTISSSGKSTRIYSSGSHCKILSTGVQSFIDCQGEHSTVVCQGANSFVKAVIGTWVTLTEFANNNVDMLCVRTEYVDGVRIKADTWYTLKDNDFVETEI